MSMSIYDFDTQSGPFEAFAPFAPYAPFALLSLLSAPYIWWADAVLSSYSTMSDAMVNAMTYPFELSVSTASPVVLPTEDEHPAAPKDRGAKRGVAV